MSNLSSKFLSTLFGDDTNVQEYDLKTEEGYEAFKKEVKELKANDTFKTLLGLFGVDMDELVDSMSDLADSIYEEAKEEKEENEKALVKKEETNDVKKQFVRPSDMLSYDHKLQLHKIVQEYIDTMVTPFNNGKLTKDQINDAYAGLYEFAAWVINR